MPTLPTFDENLFRYASIAARMRDEYERVDLVDEVRRTREWLNTSAATASPGNVARARSVVTAYDEYVKHPKRREERLCGNAIVVTTAYVEGGRPKGSWDLVVAVGLDDEQAALVREAVERAPADFVSLCGTPHSDTFESVRGVSVVRMRDLNPVASADQRIARGYDDLRKVLEEVEPDAAPAP